MSKELTPLMKQYWEIKSVHMDKILFFRMGDFFELFDQDAIVAAPILGIALTSRNKNNPESAPMCGMPHHSIAQYINKLLSHNYKIAICDQIEDPATAKGIVKRAVTRILSPGMVFDPETLDQIQNNYIASFDKKYISFLDSTTGEAFYYEYRTESEMKMLIEILRPVEMVLSKPDYELKIQNKTSIESPCLTEHEGLFDIKRLKHFVGNEPESALRLLSYAVFMQGEEVLNTLSLFEERKLSQKLDLNPQAILHLELFETYRGEKEGSFFSAINKTKSAAGARRLRNWVQFPLFQKEEILSRQKAIELWMSHYDELKEARSLLSKMGDIERRLGKISSPGCNARDLVSLKDSIKAGLAVSQIKASLHENSHFHSDGLEFRTLEEMIHRVESTIVDEPPLTTKSGHMIRGGVSEALDELIKLNTDSQSLLFEMEQKEKSLYQIPSLKIRYNQVFGFYIEVTKTHLDKVPKHYVRKQTLTNAERFITDELYQLESKILSAKAKREDLEFSIFEDLKGFVLRKAHELLSWARSWSEMDAISSLAWLAVEWNYVKPEFFEGGKIDLQGARHPVIEQLSSKNFIPNDIQIHRGGCLLLTGPNMAGKSTLMRQVALITLLAQMGSFVPASKAQIPLFDRIFTRIGASDNLTKGLSTFMVEMTETAYLLNNATSDSLIILDEIGRGTSTYDGMSLAQSILEYLVTKVSATVLFATHYHELTTLSDKYSQIKNAHMKVSERLMNGRKEIAFLYTLTNGAGNKSYGIEVAKLAGLPDSVIRLAKEILKSKEALYANEDLPLFSSRASFDASGGGLATTPKAENPRQERVLEELIETSISQLTPLEALNKIADWQKHLI